MHGFPRAADGTSDDSHYQEEVDGVHEAKLHFEVEPKQHCFNPEAEGQEALVEHFWQAQPFSEQV